MARGTATSFSDALQGLLGTVGQMIAAPDADIDFIMQLRAMIMDKLSGGGPQQQGGMPIEAPPGGLPVTEAGQSRGPAQAPDMAGATSELQRILAGS